MNKNWKSLAAVGLLIVSLALVWMHRFQYEHVGVALIRVNRFTGRGCYFIEGKWDSRSAGEPIPLVDKDANILFGSSNFKPNSCE